MHRDPYVSDRQMSRAVEQGLADKVIKLGLLAKRGDVIEGKRVTRSYMQDAIRRVVLEGGAVREYQAPSRMYGSPGCVV